MNQSAIPNSKSKIVVIGVGNDFRSDDAIGLVAARHLRERAPRQVTIIEHNGDGAALLEAWKEADAVILIDAVHSGANPGTIHRFNAHSQPIPTKFFHYSSHAFSVAEAIELARGLGQLPPRLVVYGVEGKTFVAGTALSPEVQASLRELLLEIEGEISLIT